MRRSCRNRMRWYQRVAIAALIAVLAAAIWFFAPRLARWWAARSVDGELCVYFLDVGEADASIIVCDDKVLMIDGGNAADSSLIYSMLRNTLGITHIDRMIATHPHEDHVGGLSGALNACKVDKLYTPVLDYESSAFESMLKYARLQGTSFIVPEPGDIFWLGDARVEFLGPLRDYAKINDQSIVCRVSFGATSFLFGGDIEAKAEGELVEHRARLRADVLKVNHHGSNSSSSEAFLRKVKPHWAVISVSAGNGYDHPSEEVLGRLRNLGANILRTDEMGTIRCVSDGDKLRFDRFDVK